MCVFKSNKETQLGLGGKKGGFLLANSMLECIVGKTDRRNQGSTFILHHKATEEPDCEKDK